MRGQLISLVLLTIGDREKKAVVPRAFTVTVTEVSIGVEGVVALEEAANETISGALYIHHLEVDGVPDDDTDFEVFGGLLRDIPQRCSFIGGHHLVDFGPHNDGTLTHFGAVVVQLTVLDRLVLPGLEIRAEVTILKVNSCLTDQVITEEQIVVPELNLELGAAREDSLELEHLVDFGLHIILHMVVAAVANIAAKDDLYVGVGSTVRVTGGKVDCSHNVDTDIAFLLLHKETLDDFIGLNIDNLPHDLQMGELHGAHELFEFSPALSIEDSAGTGIEAERFCAAG